MRTIFAAIVGLVPLFAGCGADSMFAVGTPKTESASKSQQTGGVAVLDMDEVALHMGQVEVITNNVQRREQFYDQELAKLKQDYRDQVSREQANLGVQPDSAQIAQLRQQLDTQFQGEVRGARGAVQTYQTQMVNEFRDLVRPIAQQVATDQGLSIVISKNDLLFTFDDSVDITDEVIERLKAEPVAETATAAPPAQPER